MSCVTTLTPHAVHAAQEAADKRMSRLERAQPPAAAAAGHTPAAAGGDGGDVAALQARRLPQHGSELHAAARMAATCSISLAVGCVLLPAKLHGRPCMPHNALFMPKPPQHQRELHSCTA
jgi:hypothetical protein